MTSIDVIHKKRGRGRPAREDGQMPVTPVRLPAELVARVGAWAGEQAPPMGKSEAIRVLIERGLGVGSKSGY